MEPLCQTKTKLAKFKSSGALRILLLFFGLFFLFSLLVVRFFWLQIIENDKWKKRALAQHQLILDEIPKRGVFYASPVIKKGILTSKVPLVVDIPKYHLFADCIAIPPEIRSEFSEQLAKLLPQNNASFLENEFAKPSRARRLCRWLIGEDKERIEKFWFPYAKKHHLPKNALFFQQDFQRSYPYGSLAGSLLQTIREDKDPKTHRSIPTGGLELYYNDLLEGKKGKRLLFKSPRHPLDSGKLLQKAVDGYDIYLTIDPHIQAIVEEALEEGVKRVNAKGGWAVMIDPSNGKILSLAQYPTFDPSDYKSFYTDPIKKNYAQLQAGTYAFEPGSIFKPLTTAVCLVASEEHHKQTGYYLFDINEKMATSPCMLPGRNKILKDLTHHKYLNFAMALQKSSNVYMGKIAKLAVDAKGPLWYRNELKDIFGIGAKVDLPIPSQTSGLLPMPGKSHKGGRPQWSAGTPYTIAMGYNVMVNGLQIARAYCVFANGGYYVEPYLVEKISRMEDGKEQIHFERPQGTIRKKVLSESITKLITNSIKYTTKTWGTGRRGDIPGYTEAGKTGTTEKVVNGQYSKVHHFSSFVGFAPEKKNPRFVLYIGIDEPETKYIPGVGKNHLGGYAAAPIFKQIGEKTLRYMGVDRDDPLSLLTSRKKEQGLADWEEETEKLRKLYQEWNH